MEWFSLRSVLLCTGMFSWFLASVPMYLAVIADYVTPAGRLAGIGLFLTAVMFCYAGRACLEAAGRAKTGCRRFLPKSFGVLAALPATVFLSVVCVVYRLESDNICLHLPDGRIETGLVGGGLWLLGCIAGMAAEAWRRKILFGRLLGETVVYGLMAFCACLLFRPYTCWIGLGGGVIIWRYYFCRPVRAENS